eukprot:CAMPEP_0180667316 /NCGR_PEP_ID=MMETSP1037_2-20121125/62313_1 /TAXON_ID=632150 /ORGANISM="Azadinium spinosum, Strain 3D9" /LENGTH=73 /DNA_ID=CAMNT_0022695943 /DNA_START=162 /DNA_END=383 /DNA_ORIENTATION=-
MELLRLRDGRVRRGNRERPGGAIQERNGDIVRRCHALPEQCGLPLRGAAQAKPEAGRRCRELLAHKVKPPASL